MSSTVVYVYDKKHFIMLLTATLSFLWLSRKVDYVCRWLCPCYSKDTKNLLSVFTLVLSTALVSNRLWVHQVVYEVQVCPLLQDKLHCRNVWFGHLCKVVGNEYSLWAIHSEWISLSTSSWRLVCRKGSCLCQNRSERLEAALVLHSCMLTSHLNHGYSCLSLSMPHFFIHFLLFCVSDRSLISILA